MTPGQMLFVTFMIGSLAGAQWGVVHGLIISSVALISGFALDEWHRQRRKT